MGIAENLRRLRQEADLSQNDLADKAKVSQQLISQIERGVNTTTKHLPALARALNVSVFEIDPTFSPADLGSPSEQAEELLRIADRLERYPHLLAHLLDQARQVESLARDLEGRPTPKAAGGQ